MRCLLPQSRLEPRLTTSIDDFVVQRRPSHARKQDKRFLRKLANRHPAPGGKAMRDGQDDFHRFVPTLIDIFEVQACEIKLRFPNAMCQLDSGDRDGREQDIGEPPEWRQRPLRRQPPLS